MRVVNLHTEHGCKTVVMGDPGRKWTPYVMIEFPVRLRKIKNVDIARYSRDTDYPVKKACRQFLRIGRQRDITKGAYRFLRGALQ